MNANPPIFPSPGSFFIIQTFDLVIPLSDNPADILRALGISDWSDVIGSFDMGPPQAVFTSVHEDRIEELVETAKQRDPNYKTFEYKQLIRVAPDLQKPIDDQIDVLRTNIANKDVYYDPPGIPATEPASANPFYDYQGYLRPAPKGINAMYAWAFAGGDGNGEKYIDLELGWTLDHEDLEEHGVVAPLYGAIDDNWRPHGTNSLGVVSALSNDKGIVGVAAGASFKVVSYHNDTRANAMLAAINDLDWGDVLLIEAQLETLWNGSVTFSKVPVELQPNDLKMIQLATAIGITVIEAAGNGNHNLADVTNKDGFFVLDGKTGDSPSHADFTDSGAVIVGGARHVVPHVKTGSSNFGRRVDNYSWGNNVWTTTTNNSGTEKDGYTGVFSGTSSASAIVAGAAISLQGIANQILGFRLSAMQVRGILGNISTGTALEGGVTNVIGVQPDLQKILQDDLIGVAPDLYIRDNILDAGDPHSGIISMSPDVIVITDVVADPQAEFGEGSGTENLIDLSQPVTTGADHYVYVRVRNRGAFAATNVEVKIYWAPVSTLVTPDLWNPIGVSTIGSVPAADVLTVANPLIWLSGSLPPAGHYCFVAVASCDEDPFPVIPSDLAWEHFVGIVRESNNVTWRNFNVVEYTPDSGSPLPEYVPIDFMAYGDQHRDQMMDLELRARLPQGSEILIEMPLRLFEHLSYRFPVLDIPSQDRRFIRLNSHGAFSFKNVKFPKAERWKCQLHVKIDRQYRDNRYQIFARQIFRNTEVGRVTWSLGPATTSQSGRTKQRTVGNTQMKMIDKIARELKAAGLNDQQIAKATQIISDNLPSKVYLVAVWFIGLITMALVVGALILMNGDTKNMEPVWVAVGAGLGALAGIFASKK